MHPKLDVKRSWKSIMTSILLIVSLVIPVYATESIDELEVQNTTLSQELEGINEEIITLLTELEEIETKIELTEGQMGRTLEELAESKREETKQYESMKARIRFMYETGDVSFLEMLCGAEDMADFVNKVDFINNVTEYDREMLDALTKARQEIEYEEENIKEEQRVFLELQQEDEKKVEELQLKAEETSTDLEVVQAKIQAIYEEEARIAAEKEAAEAAKREEEAAKQEEANNATSDSGSDYGGSASDLDLFAAIIDCESGGDYTARLAVATVIMNRVDSSRFPNDLHGVIYAPGQFSPTWTGKLERRLELGASALSYQVAQDAMSGKRLDSISDCYYFLYSGSTSRPGVVIGGNLFFPSW